MVFGGNRPLNVADYQKMAQRRLPAIVWDFLEGGAEDEQGLAYNRSVFDRYRFEPRRLRNVGRRTVSTSLLDRPAAAPLVIAPTGVNGLFWPKGDLILAQAAARAGIPFVLSTASSMTLEEVAQQSDGDRWFQLYVVRPEFADALVIRALEHDYTTLVVTVDVTVNGARERDQRNGFGLPMRYSPSIIWDGVRHPRWSMALLRNGMPQLANFTTFAGDDPEVQQAVMRREMDATFDWQALERLRERWPRKLLVKGILSPVDAAKCVQLGADGVILSNHGGRQLDALVSPMDVLASTAEAIPGATVLADSGFRRGADVLKALALGAQGVLLGRATLYGLAAAGRLGVDHVIDLLKSEIDRSLALLGCASVGDLNPAMVRDIRTI